MAYVISIMEPTLHHSHGQGPELQPDLWPSSPSFSFPGHLRETNAAGFQRNCWVNCWTDEEAVFQEHTPGRRKWCAWPGGIPQKCIERVSIEKLVRLFITKNGRRLGDEKVHYQSMTGYNRTQQTNIIFRFTSWLNLTRLLFVHRRMECAL